MILFDILFPYQSNILKTALSPSAVKSRYETASVNTTPVSMPNHNMKQTRGKTANRNINRQLEKAS